MANTKKRHINPASMGTWPNTLCSLCSREEINGNTGQDCREVWGLGVSQEFKPHKTCNRQPGTVHLCPCTAQDCAEWGCSPHCVFTGTPLGAQDLPAGRFKLFAATAAPIVMQEPKLDWDLPGASQHCCTKPAEDLAVKVLIISLPGQTAAKRIAPLPCWGKKEQNKVQL